MKTNQSPLALAAIIFITCHLQVLAFQSIVGRGGHKPLSARPNPIENEKTITVPRRQLLDSVMTSLLASTTIASIPSAASATVVGKPMSINVQSNSPEREALLQALSKKSSDEVVLRAIQNLIPLNPMKSKSSAKYASELDGEWRLLWYNKSDFSPLLKLPSPLRPDSFQYFGSVAEKEVGVGRVAQGLTGGILSALGPDKELWLSSGAVAKEDDPSILEIYPPFRFQLGDKPGSSAEKQTIIDSQSDADFRAVNARTTEAQMAPKNEYEQLYLENFGSGSLRISVVARGDPVIVGDMFVHQKI
jgi:hypothetical protein